MVPHHRTFADCNNHSSTVPGGTGALLAPGAGQPKGEKSTLS